MGLIWQFNQNIKL